METPVVLIIGTIKMLAQVGATEKIVELCDEWLETFANSPAAEQSVQPTVLTRCPNDGNLLLMGFCDQCKSQYPHSG